MKSELSKFIIFVAGAIIGSFVTWKITKEKYEKIANDEIESVKESFSRKTKNEKEETKETVKEMVESLGYSSRSETFKPEEKGVDNVKRPYVIDPNELGETDYEIFSLVYYSDGVLADDWDNVIEDVDGYVGLDSLTHFGDHGDDSVCVRNDEMQVDFEIVLDVRPYEDVVNPSSHFMEDE